MWAGMHGLIYFGYETEPKSKGDSMMNSLWNAAGSIDF